MLVVQRAGERPGFSVDQKRVGCHAGNVFENDGVVSGISGGRSPTKGCVPSNQYRRNRIWIELGERAADGLAGLEFVVGGNFLGTEGLGYRNRPVEIVGVRSAKAWDRSFRLSPGGGEFRVRVRHSADVGKVSVQLEVRGQIGGRAKLGFYQRALNAPTTPLLALPFLVRSAAGLAGDQAFSAVDAAGVPEGIYNQPATD